MSPFKDTIETLESLESSVLRLEDIFKQFVEHDRPIPVAEISIFAGLLRSFSGTVGLLATELTLLESDEESA